MAGMRGIDISESPFLCLCLAMIPLGLALYGTITGTAVLRSARIERAKNPMQYWLMLLVEYAGAAILIAMFVHGELEQIRR